MRKLLTFTNRLTALSLVAALYPTCAISQQLPPRRNPIPVTAKIDGCSPGNPMYELLPYNYGVTMNVSVCYTKLATGVSEEQGFMEYSVPQNSPPIVLGCDVDSGIYEQHFYAFWEEAEPYKPPTNITYPDASLRVYTSSCGSMGCLYYLSNRNFFKPIQVTYDYREEHATVVVVQPLRDTLLTGFSHQAPTLRQVAFLSPYQQGKCVSGTDNYPAIPSVH